MSMSIWEVYREIETCRELSDGWMMKNIMIFLRHPTAHLIHCLIEYIKKETDLLDDDTVDFSEIVFYVDTLERSTLNNWDLYDDVIDELEDKIIDCVWYNPDSGSWDLHIQTWFSFYGNTPDDVLSSSDDTV